MKPGWQTTEAWQAAGTQFITLIVLMGVINSQDSVALANSWGALVTGSFLVITNVITVVNYIQTRLKLKQQAMTANRN